MTDDVGSFNDRLHASLDGLAILPLAFMIVLGFFVLATVVFEDTPHAAAAVIELRAEG